MWIIRLILQSTFSYRNYNRWFSCCQNKPAILVPPKGFTTKKSLCEEFFCTTFPNREPFIAFYPVPFQPPNSFGGQGWFIVDFRISQILAETPGGKKISMYQSIEITETDFNSFSTNLRSFFMFQLPPWKIIWKPIIMKVWFRWFPLQTGDSQVPMFIFQGVYIFVTHL